MMGRGNESRARTTSALPTSSSSTPSSRTSEGGLFDDVWGPAFQLEQLRLVLCKESSLQGNTLLFDTHVPQPRHHRRAPAPAINSINPTTAPTATTRSASASAAVDANVPAAGSLNPTLLGELMFGALPLAFLGTATKVHMIDNSEHIFITKLFRHFAPSMEALSLPKQAGEDQGPAPISRRLLSTPRVAPDDASPRLLKPVAGHG